MENKSRSGERGERRWGFSESLNTISLFSADVKLCGPGYEEEMRAAEAVLGHPLPAPSPNNAGPQKLRSAPCWRHTPPSKILTSMLGIAVRTAATLLVTVGDGTYYE